MPAIWNRGIFQPNIVRPTQRISLCFFNQGECFRRKETHCLVPKIILVYNNHKTKKKQFFCPKYLGWEFCCIWGNKQTFYHTFRHFFDIRQVYFSVQCGLFYCWLSCSFCLQISDYIYSLEVMKYLGIFRLIYFNNS